MLEHPDPWPRPEPTCRTRGTRQEIRSLLQRDPTSAYVILASALPAVRPHRLDVATKGACDCPQEPLTPTDRKSQGSFSRGHVKPTGLTRHTWHSNEIRPTYT